MVAFLDRVVVFRIDLGDEYGVSHEPWIRFLGLKATIRIRAFESRSKGTLWTHEGQAILPSEVFNAWARDYPGAVAEEVWDQGWVAVGVGSGTFGRASAEDV